MKTIFLLIPLKHILNINFIFKDVTKLTTTDIPDVDIVFYLVAAEAHNETAYKKAYIDGLNNLCESLNVKKHKPKRII